MIQFKHIPANIISGFLGAGKTTAVQYLIDQKPESERWAVIVNEFGQIGIDGALLENNTVAVKEIPGGCLCCVGSLSFNAGLNQLIRQTRPDRILIEPTGLGHPRKLIESLRGEFYKDVLDLRAVINLVDARQLNDRRYREHETFIAQVQLADVLVASKLDTYSETDRQKFYEYASSCQPAKQKVVMVEHGRIKCEWLDIEHSLTREAPVSTSHEKAYEKAHEHEDEAPAVCDTDERDWLMVEEQGSEYMSVGWKISADYSFSRDGLLHWISQLPENAGVERVKGVIKSGESWLSINHTSHEQSVTSRGAYSFSILEIISSAQLNASMLDAQLKSMAINK